MEGANYKETWSSKNKLGKYNSLNTLWCELCSNWQIYLRVIVVFFSSPKSGKVAMTLSYVEMEA